MNYTILVMGILTVVMALGWILEGRKSFSPPRDDSVMVGIVPALGGTTLDPEAGREKGESTTIDEKMTSACPSSSNIITV